VVVEFRVNRSDGETPELIAKREFKTFDDAYNTLVVVCNGDKDEMNKYYIEKIWRIKL